ncbi:MAG TPA: phosphatase PAP2 family protein, partial [Gaiellaceae bacterium]|nr:phosphatase PAP2 family protein [Gaiellaceae bacterium]
VAGTLGLTVLTALVVFAADSVSFGVKDLVRRTRPFVAHPQIHPLYVVHSSSFPAGHAATAFAGAALLSYVARRGTPFFVLLAVAIGFSRVYVGVHYPGDVLAGAAIGCLTGLAGVGILLAAGRLRERRRARPAARRSPHATASRARATR